MARPRSRSRLLLFRVMLLLAAAAVAGGALVSTIAGGAFDPETFGARIGAGLADPRVSAFAADRVTRAVIEQRPDLTAVRPLILGAVQGLASSEPFRAVVSRAAASAHRTLFAEGTRRVVLSVPDVGILLRSVFERGNPELAKRIPERLQTVVTSLESGAATEIVVDLWGLREELRKVGHTALLVSSLLLLVGIWLADDRRHGLVGAGVALIGAGVVVAALLPVGSAALSAWIPQPLERGAAAGLWRVFMSALYGWGLFLAGVGVLFAAAGTSLLEAFEPVEWIRQGTRWLAAQPSSTCGRVARGAGLLLMGVLAVTAPAAVASLLVAAAGIVIGFLGARELFRVVLESVEAAPAVARVPASHRSTLRTGVTLTLTMAIVALWVFLRNPLETGPTGVVANCNGHAKLCERRVNEVVFAGAHNAMSNAEIPDWMFPHHEARILSQLREGVRALLIDVHYGFPGGSRIKTDLSGQRPTTEAMEHALGPEGVEAALRIRDRLVGVDEGKRGIYLCHGFCEIGAYELVPTLRDIRGFLVQNPGEVLLIVVEDYVSPEDLARALGDSGLADFVYRGRPGPPWPMLRQLVATGQRVLVFLESGRSAVSWLLPAFELIQETPFTFHTPEEFSCRPNRGPHDASLFQVNHWIETTPAPRPSNAALVNTYERLLSRARQCQRERGLLPNIVAVDFYRTGDLFRVVDDLNGMRTD